VSARLRSMNKNLLSGLLSNLRFNITFFIRLNIFLVLEMALSRLDVIRRDKATGALTISRCC